MNKFLVLLLSLFGAISISAQDNYILKENFDDLSPLWYHGSNKNKTITTQNGYLKVEMSEKDVCTPSTIGIALNPDKNFSIEMKVRQVTGQKNSTGLCMIDKRKSGHHITYKYSINADGLFYISKQREENGNKYEFIKNWTACKAIKERSEDWNILKLEKIDRIYKFSINGKTVATLKEEFYGSWVGVTCCGKAQYKIDYLYVTQDQSINTVTLSEIQNAPVKLGKNVNSKRNENYPNISGDGETLYFCVDSDDKDKKKINREDIYYCKKQKDGSWSEPLSPGEPLNNEAPNFVFSVTADNNAMLLGGLYNAEGKPAGNGVSKTSVTQTGWSNPVPVDIPGFVNLNSYNSYFLTFDRKYILMEIETEDSYGGLDLYYSRQNYDGTWTTPVNLGDDINTYQDDGTPFLAYDGKTLYFSSKGWPGYGSRDIFMSTRLDDTWQKWSEPVNLGKPINSKAFDQFFILSGNGEMAYMTSTREDLSDLDIYSVELNKKLRPPVNVRVEGKVLETGTLKTLKANITIYGEDVVDVKSFSQSSALDGSYSVILPAGEKYYLYAEKKGYLTIDEPLDLTGYSGYVDIDKIIYMTPEDNEKIPDDETIQRRKKHGTRHRVVF